jgi:hypothetical protein
MIKIISVDRTHPEHQKPLELMSHSIEKEFLEYHLENIFNKM